MIYITETIKIDGYYIPYCIYSNSLGYDINTTIEQYYKTIKDDEYFKDRWNENICTPKNWFKAVSTSFNYLSSKWEGQYRPIIKEYQWVSKYTPYISVSIEFYSENKSMVKGFYNSIDKKEFKGIIREEYCYYDKDVKLYKALFIIVSLGCMDYEDFSRFTAEYSDYCKPIEIDYSKKDPLIKEIYNISIILSLIVIITLVLFYYYVCK
ncbi:hypothetical protein B0619_07960 [Campylobacter lari]|nr:hypothetical protein [Campylobacter lari]EAK5787125.1 hypothetical protein [Campylobacter lari]